MNIRLTCIALGALTLVACGGGGGGNAPATPGQVNAAPAVSAAGNQTLTANEAGKTVAITVTDENPATVIVSAVSGNAQVIDPASLRVTGEGAARSLLLAPGADVTGNATITLTATDSAGLSATARITVTVAAEEKSMQQFARTVFSAKADEDPELINAVDFVMDAQDDDFADLLLP